MKRESTTTPTNTITIIIIIPTKLEKKGNQSIVNHNKTNDKSLDSYCVSKCVSLLVSSANGEDGYIDVEQRRPATHIHYIVANGQQTSMHSENSIKYKTITHTIENNQKKARKFVKRKNETMHRNNCRKCIDNAKPSSTNECAYNALYL